MAQILGAMTRQHRQSERTERFVRPKSKTAQNTLRLRPDLDSGRGCLPVRQAGAQGDVCSVISSLASQRRMPKASLRENP